MSKMTGSNPGIGTFDIGHVIKDAGFVRRDEVVWMTIYPEEMQTTFWDDLANEFSEIKNQGVQRSESKTYLDSQVESMYLGIGPGGFLL